MLLRGMKNIHIYVYSTAKKIFIVGLEYKHSFTEEQTLKIEAIQNMPM